MEDQDVAEVLDETHLNEDADEFATFEDVPDVLDVTQAIGDAEDDEAVDEADFDPEAFDEDALEDVDDADGGPLDDLEDEAEDDNLEDDLDDPDDEDAIAAAEPDEVELVDVADVDPGTNPRDDEPDKYESTRELSDADLQELGYQDPAHHPDEEPNRVTPHQDALLDEAVEETFPGLRPDRPQAGRLRRLTANSLDRSARRPHLWTRGDRYEDPVPDRARRRGRGAGGLCAAARARRPRAAEARLAPGLPEVRRRPEAGQRRL
ncbi:MAG: hypothetical protein WDM92_01695 [Caulobacteraceae bacterium]